MGDAVNRAELRLPGTQSLRRVLWLTMGTMNLSVCMYPPAPNKRAASLGYRHGAMLAWANALLTECRIDYSQPSSSCLPSLWVNHTAFDVTPAEAERIRETFAPLGMRVIEKTEESEASEATPL